MKVAVIIYHANALKIYKREWIDMCIKSIRSQTFQEFDVFELNYGQSNGCDQLWNTELAENPYFFYCRPLENHCLAMNLLYDELFLRQKYDVVFNTNVDDFFRPERFEIQLKALNEGNYDLVSSNFVYVNDKNVITKHLRVTDKGDINVNLLRNHNVIAHPCVAMARSFWTNAIKYENSVGNEDLLLWQRGVREGKKYYICPEFLLHYRIHENQITKQLETKK